MSMMARQTTTLVCETQIDHAHDLIKKTLTTAIFSTERLV
jgi:hypothetical protein